MDYHSNQRKWKNAIDNAMILTVVLYALLCQNPYFIWGTFKNGLFSSFLGIPYRTIIGLAAVALWLLSFFLNRAWVSKRKLLGSASIMALAFMYICLPDNSTLQDTFSLVWLPYCACAALFVLPDGQQKKAYELYLTVFALTLILPIIYYVLLHVGIHIPYSKVEATERIKMIRGEYYKHFPFAIQRTAYTTSASVEMKLCGIYDESGRLGTICGLFLVAEQFRIWKNWRNIVVLIAGILSFSLAFYAMIAIYFVCVAIQRRRLKVLLALVMVVLMYFVFMNIQFKDERLTAFQNRFAVSSEGLAGDNRTNDSFDQLIEDFNSSQLRILLFGYGDGAIGEIQNARNIDGSSYKCLIYNFGYLGFGLSIVWYVLYMLIKVRRQRVIGWGVVTLVIVYLANIYQRPSTFFIGYFMILVGGIAKLSIAASQRREVVKGIRC